VFKPVSARTELLAALFDTSTFRKVVKKLEKHGKKATLKPCSACGVSSKSLLELKALALEGS